MIRGSRITGRKRRQEIYNFIRQDKIGHAGASPSIREIGAAVGISSTSVVRYHLGKLDEQGVIQLVGHRGGDRQTIFLPGESYSLPESVQVR